MQRQHILGLEIDITNIQQASEDLLIMAQTKPGAYICFANAHMCIVAQEDPVLRRAVNGASLVLADGKPLSMIQKWHGHSAADQVRGTDMLLALCEKAEIEQLNIGLYGGSSDMVLDQLEAHIYRLYPKLNLTYRYSPPFRPPGEMEEASIIKQINSSKVDILFVGLGCPKQETWMANHHEKLNCLLLGVGAAFDYISGSTPQAPRYIQASGFEWLFRLMAEPRRLWKRYLKTNSLFMWRMARQLIHK